MAIIKVITPSVTDANITTAKVTDNAITLAKMASGTDGNIISYDASGNPVAIATGSDGQVLTSTGAGSAPAFETPAAGFTPGFSQVLLTGDIALSGSGYLTQSGAGAALGIYNASAAGTGIVTSTTSGHITLDKTGKYLIMYQLTGHASSSADEFIMNIKTWNGSAESNIAYGYMSVKSETGSATQTNNIMVIKDVDNVSNIKFHMAYEGASNITLRGTGMPVTAMTFIRLGDT
jgi:hypothetical protein